MNNVKIKEFINYIFFSGDVINITRIEEPEPENRKGKIQSKNFKYELFPNIKDLPSQGTFICPNPLKENTQRAEKNLSKIQTVFIDFDSDNNDLKKTLKKLNEINLIPNIISKRSETNQHFYYLIEPVSSDKLNLLKYKAIVSYFIENFGADAQVKNPAGLIRLPETIRYKDENKEKYSFELKSNSKYTLDEIIKILNISITESIEEEIKEIKQKIIDFDPVKHIIDRNKKLYEVNKYSTGTKETEETLYLYRMGLECRDWGLSNEKALEVAFELNDIIFEPPVKQHIIKHQINSAFRYARNDAGTRLKEWEEQGDLKAQKKYLAGVYEEERVREKLKNYCFVLNSMTLINKKRYVESYSGKEHFTAFLSSKINTTLNISKIKLKGLIHIVDKMDFRPDITKQEFTDSDGLTCLNRYLGIPFEKIKTKEIDSKGLGIFLDHIKYLTNSEYEFKTLISYLAHKIQHPEIKIPWVPLLVSSQTGTGRSWLAELLSKFFDEYLSNVTHNNLKFGYTQYKVDKLFIVMHEIKDNDNYSFVETFKEQVTESKFWVDEKYTRSYRMTDCINYLFFSNHFDALRIDNSDRRFFVILNTKMPLDEKYYDVLYNITNNSDIQKLTAIYEYLKNYDLSDFNPFKRPELTEGKKIMIETTATELYLFLDEMRNDKTNSVFKHPFVLIRDIQNYVQTNGSEIIRKKVSEKQIKIYLMKCNFKEIDLERRIGEHRIHRKIWVAEGFKNNLTNTEIIKTLGLDVKENDFEEQKY